MLLRPGLFEGLNDVEATAEAEVDPIGWTTWRHF